MQSTSTTITGAATETASATTTLIEPSAFVINFVDRSVQWDAQYSNETAGAYMDLSEDYKRNLTAAFDANEERNVTISGIQFT